MPKIKPHQKEHYVDNKKFYSEMIKFKKSCEESDENNDMKPRVPPYIGECIMKIAYKLSNKEKKGLYTKFKATELFNLHNSLSPEDTEFIKSSANAAENASIFIRDFEEKRFNK